MQVLAISGMFSVTTLPQKGLPGLANSAINRSKKLKTFPQTAEDEEAGHGDTATNSLQMQ